MNIQGLENVLKRKTPETKSFDIILRGLQKRARDFKNDHLRSNFDAIRIHSFNKMQDWYNMMKHNAMKSGISHFIYSDAVQKRLTIQNCAERSMVAAHGFLTTPFVMSSNENMVRIINNPNISKYDKCKYAINNMHAWAKRQQTSEAEIQCVVAWIQDVAPLLTDKKHLTLAMKPSLVCIKDQLHKLHVEMKLQVQRETDAANVKDPNAAVLETNAFYPCLLCIERGHNILSILIGENDEYHSLGTCVDKVKQLLEKYKSQQAQGTGDITIHHLMKMANRFAESKFKTELVSHDKYGKYTEHDLRREIFRILYTMTTCQGMKLEVTAIMRDLQLIDKMKEGYTFLFFQNINELKLPLDDYITSVKLRLDKYEEQGFDYQRTERDSLMQLADGFKNEEYMQEFEIQHVIVQEPPEPPVYSNPNQRKRGYDTLIRLNAIFQINKSKTRLDYIVKISEYLKLTCEDERRLTGFVLGPLSTKPGHV